MPVRMKIKKNDQVIVISGRDKGKRGRVLEIITKDRKVLVEGVNILKHFVRPNSQKKVTGGIVPLEAPMDVSNVMVLENGVPVRVGYQILEDGRKIRVSKKTGAALD